MYDVHYRACVKLPLLHPFCDRGALCTSRSSTHKMCETPLARRGWHLDTAYRNVTQQWRRHGNTSWKRTTRTASCRAPISRRRWTQTHNNGDTCGIMGSGGGDPTTYFDTCLVSHRATGAHEGFSLPQEGERRYGKERERREGGETHPPKALKRGERDRGGLDAGRVLLPTPAQTTRRGGEGASLPE